MLRISRLPLLLCALVLAAACAPEGEPAISVDGMHFYDGEVAPLDEREMASLADLAALAAAVRDDALPELVEPLIERQVHRARLEVLGRALAAREMGLGDAELRAAYEADPDVGAGGEPRDPPGGAGRHAPVSGRRRGRPRKRCSGGRRRERTSPPWPPSIARSRGRRIGAVGCSRGGRGAGCRSSGRRRCGWSRAR
jgi:hypothetical protein